MPSKDEHATIRSAQVKVHTQSNLTGTLLLLHMPALSCKERKLDHLESMSTAGTLYALHLQV